MKERLKEIAKKHRVDYNIVRTQFAIGVLIEGIKIQDTKQCNEIAEKNISKDYMYYAKRETHT